MRARHCWPISPLLPPVVAATPRHHDPATVMPLLGKALQVGGGVFHLPFAQLDFEGAPASIIAVVVLGSDWVCLGMAPDESFDLVCSGHGGGGTGPWVPEVWQMARPRARLRQYTFSSSLPGSPRRPPLI